jgi:hypothetical protein
MPSRVRAGAESRLIQNDTQLMHTTSTAGTHTCNR